MAARLTAYVVVGIVAATLIAGLMAQRDDYPDGLVDIIIHNAKVCTAGTNGTIAEAVPPSAATKSFASEASARSRVCASRRRR